MKPAVHGRVTRIRWSASASLVGVFIVAGVSAQTPSTAPSADCGTAPSVQGSRWDLVEESRPFFKPNVESFEFGSGGKLIHHTPNGAFQGTWSQKGGCVYFDQSQFGDKISEWTGTVKGSRMEGTGKNLGDGYTWALLRRGGAPAGTPGGGPARRSLQPGGPESLVRTGTANYSRVEESGEVKSFSFTVGPRGNLLGAGADRDKTVKRLYDVTLYLDEAGARQAFARFKVKDLQKQLAKKDIHQAVLGGGFDKLVELRFSRNWSAKEVRQDFAESLGARTSLDDPAVGEFMKCVARDVKLGDEMVIRVSKTQALSVSTGGNSCAEIASPALSRALLGIWIGPGLLSSQPGGLLSEAGPLLKQ